MLSASSSGGSKCLSQQTPYMTHAYHVAIINYYIVIISYELCITKIKVLHHIDKLQHNSHTSSMIDVIANIHLGGDGVVDKTHVSGVEDPGSIPTATFTNMSLSETVMVRFIYLGSLRLELGMKSHSRYYICQRPVTSDIYSNC